MSSALIAFAFLSTPAGSVLPLPASGERCFWPLVEHPHNAPLVLNLTRFSLGSAAPAHSQQYIVLCACPKAASLTLRAIAKASTRGRAGRYLIVKNIFDPELPYITRARDDPGLYGLLWNGAPPLVRRLMVVRHPVARVLHGALQLYPTITAAGFERIVTLALHRRSTRYDANCGYDTQQTATHGLFQHFAPPQHCRCGLPCGAKFDVLRIEDRSRPLRAVLLAYGVPEIWLPPVSRPGEAKHSKGHGVNESLWLSAGVLATLNAMTARERFLLGYAPYQLGVPLETLLAEPLAPVKPTTTLVSLARTDMNV